LEQEFDTAALEEFLYAISGQKTAVSFPKIGMKKKLLTMAGENARDCLVKSVDRTRRDYDMSEGALADLGDILGLKYLRRVECYDISHISGTDQVASGVVFINGRAEKKEYRRYKIKTVVGADDFESLAEVVGRRFARATDGDEKFAELPDLMVIDGGKGQLSHAHAAMQKAGYDIPIISLAERNEEIFTLGSSEPIVLKKDSLPLKLLIRIRDEAHRFAVTFHRNTKVKGIASKLEQIPGVGPKKRQILLKAFASLKQIEAADVETLSAVEGIDRRTAEAIADYFKKTEELSNE
jgi:excinuclease ABC subunit C